MADAGLCEPDLVASEFFDYLAKPWTVDDPPALFRKIRSIDPVLKGPGNNWFITGFHAADEAYRSRALSRAASANELIRPVAVEGRDAPEAAQAVDIILNWLLHTDDPQHARLRKIVAPAFLPRAVNNLRERIEQFVDGKLDELESFESFDFLHDFAYPMPEHMISTILGVPLEDMPRLVELSGKSAGMNTVVGRTAEEMLQQVRDSLVEQVAYFRDLVARKRAQPGVDLIDALIAAESDGDRLNENELIGMMMQLFAAGYHTTAHGLANTMLALLQNPDQWALLRDNPSLAPKVTEEILRYDPPSQGQPRIALDDVTIAGKDIRAGDHVAIVLRAANRDPARFEDPDRFLISREATKHHLGFGTGIHLCLGNGLARLEMNIAIERLAKRLGDIGLATSRLDRHHTQLASLKSLPVRKLSKRGA